MADQYLSEAESMEQAEALDEESPEEVEDRPDNELTDLDEQDEEDLAPPEDTDDEELESDEEEEESSPKKDEDDDEEEGDDEEEEEEGEPEGKGEEKPQDELLKQEVTFKADGEEVTKTVEELVQGASKAIGAERRMQVAAEREKQAKGIVDAVKKNPLDAAFRLIAPEKGEEAAYQEILAAATQIVRQELEYQAMPEEERRRVDADRRVRASEDRIRQLEEEETKRKQRLEKEQQREKALALTREIKRAAEANGLPSDHRNLRAIADVIDDAKAEGKEIGAEAAVKILVDERRKLALEGLKSLSADDLKKHAPELATQIDEEARKQRLEQRSRLKTTGKRPSTPEQQPAAKPKRTRTQRHPGYFTDFDEAMRASRKGVVAEP